MSDTNPNDPPTLEDDPAAGEPSGHPAGPEVHGEAAAMPPNEHLGGGAAIPPEIVAQLAAQMAPQPQPTIAAGPQPDRATHAERAELIAELRAKRGSDALLTYITSTRPGLQAAMARDAVRRFYEHLPTTKVDKLDLFIVSNGGDSVAPWRLMSLLREVANEVNVLVPESAFSAATLAALGADNIVMHPMGVLGPIDPSVTDTFSVDPQTGQPRPVSVEDVAAYVALVKDDVGIRHEDELVQAFSLLAQDIHPLTLGHAKRGTAQARMLGEKLLRLRTPDMDPHAVDQLLEHLTTKLHYHGHPISRAEAVELELPVEMPDEPTAKAMWDLFLTYENDFETGQMFDPLGEALAVPGVTLVPGQWSSVVLPDKRIACVESEARADVFDQTFRVAATVAPDGGIAANVASIAARWSVET